MEYSADFTSHSSVDSFPRPVEVKLMLIDDYKWSKIQLSERDIVDKVDVWMREMNVMMKRINAFACLHVPFPPGSHRARRVGRVLPANKLSVGFFFN